MKDGKDFNKCKMCQKMYLHSGSTGNMKSHLTRYHQMTMNDQSTSEQGLSANRSSVDVDLKLSETLQKSGMLWDFFNIHKQTGVLKYQCSVGNCRKMFPLEESCYSTQCSDHLLKKHKLVVKDDPSLKYFQFQTQSKGKCSNIVTKCLLPDCGQQLDFMGTSDNLREHLEGVHQHVKSNTLSSAGPVPQEHLLFMASQQDSSVSVRKQGLLAADSNDSFRGLVSSKCEAIQAIAQSELQNIRLIHLIISSWTSALNTKYYKLTAHGLDGRFVQKRVTLDFILQADVRSSKDMRDFTEKVLERYNISADLMVTWDTFSEQFASLKSWGKFPCFHQLLYCSAQQGMEVMEVKDFVQMVTDKIISPLRLEPLALGLHGGDVLGAECVPMFSTEGVQTNNWRSFYSTLEQLLNMGVQFRSHGEENRELFDIIECVVDVLRPFDVFVQTMEQGEDKPLSFYAMGLKHQMTKLQDRVNDHSVISALKEGMLAPLHETLESMKLNALLEASIFLDPMFSEQTTQQLIDSTLNCLQSGRFTQPVEPSVKRQRLSFGDMSTSYEELFGFAIPVENVTSPWHKEISSFRKEVVQDRTTHPVEWWGKNGHRFPGLQKLAQSIFGLVPCSSSPYKAIRSESARQAGDQTEHSLLETQLPFLWSNRHLIESTSMELSVETKEIISIPLRKENNGENRKSIDR